MNTLPPDMLFNLTVLLILLCVLLGFAALLSSIHGFLSRWLKLLEEEELSGADLIKQDAYKEAAALLNNAREESIKIIAETNSKAHAVLSSVDNLTKESQENITATLDELAFKHEEMLNKTSEALLSHYTQIVTKQEQSSMAALDTATTHIEKELVQQVEEFEDRVEKETVKGQKLVEDKLNIAYKNVENEINLFKEAQFKKVHESIYDILHQVSLKVFGKALSMEDHEELVLHALDEAKENNFFTKAR